MSSIPPEDHLATNIHAGIPNGEHVGSTTTVRKSCDVLDGVIGGCKKLPPTSWVPTACFRGHNLQLLPTRRVTSSARVIDLLLFVRRAYQLALQAITTSSRWLQLIPDILVSLGYHRFGSANYKHGFRQYGRCGCARR